VSGEYTSFLEDGEQVDHVVKALAGLNRWLGLSIATVVGLAVALALGGLNGSVFLGLLALYLVFTCLYVRHLILVTDRAVVLVSGNRISFKPKALVERLPAATPLRPLKGLWLELQLGEHRLYVSSRSIRQVSAVEAERRDGKRP
jgi:hypothetical protein